MFTTSRFLFPGNFEWYHRLDIIPTKRTIYFKRNSILFCLNLFSVYPGKNEEDIKVNVMSYLLACGE